MSARGRVLGALGLLAGALVGVVVTLSPSVSSQGMGGSSAPLPSVAVTGEVVAIAPDGGLRVSLGDDTVPVSGSIQAYPPDGGAEVRVTNRIGIDGVVDTNISGQSADINANITNPYVSVGTGVGAPKVSAEVTGLAGAAVTTTVSGSVLISGYSSVPTVALENGTLVSLTSASLATLTATTGKGNCTYVDGDPTATIGTTAANIPSSAMSGRTSIEIFNHSNAPANYLLCSAQGTATTASAIRIESGGQSRKWEGLGAGVLVSCKCVTGTCTYNYQEEQCYQQ